MHFDAQVRFALAGRGARHGIVGHDPRPRAALLGEGHLPRNQGRQESSGASRGVRLLWTVFVGRRAACMLREMVWL